MQTWMSCTFETGGRTRLVVIAAALLAAACTEQQQQQQGVGDTGSESDLVESVQEMTTGNGLELNGISLNGISLNGISLNGISLNGISLNGVAIEGTSFTATLPSGKTITGDGIVGAVFTAKLSNGQTLSVRIDDRVPSGQPDVFFYEASYLANQGTNSWKSLCGTNPTNGGLLRGIPLVGTWDASQKQPTSGMHLNTPDTFTFACRGFAIAKCVELGYRPWSEVQECLKPGTCKQISGEALHTACTRMLRADYCGDGVPHTKDGTQVDVFDGFGIQSPVEAGFSFEAEWMPTGARCIEHTRWIGDQGAAASAYVNLHCPTRWAAAQLTYDCGGSNSTMYAKKGFFVPISARSLLGNESKSSGN